MSLTGTEFNAKYAGLNFYKFTDATNKHYKMTYVDGENVDVNQLSLTDNKTGMYFFETNRAFTHFKEKYTHVRRVTIPDDATVVVRETSFRTTKFFLSPSIKLGEDLNLMYEFAEKHKGNNIVTEFYTAILKHEPNKEKKYEILGKLSEYGIAVVDQTNITDDKIAHVITNHPKIISVCPNVSTEMYKLALSRDGMLLKIVSDKFKNFVRVSKEHQLFANQHDAELKFYEMIQIAIEQNFAALQFVESPSDELCMMAFAQSKDADKYIKTISKNVAKFALMRYPEFVTMKKYSIGIDEESALELITNDPNYINLIPLDIQTEEMCKMALSKDIKNFKYINEKFYHLVTTVF